MSTDTTILKKAPGYRWWVLIMNLLIYSVYYISLNAAAAFGTQIQADWNCNSTMLSMMTTICQLSYVLFCGVGAAMATKLGSKKVVVISGVILLISSAIYPLIATTYEVGLVLRVLQGASGGIMSSCVVATTSLWFPVRQRGLASGILFGAIGFGFSLTVAGGNAFMNLGFNWQQSLGLLICIPGIVVTILYAITVKDVSKVYPGHDSIAEMLPAEASTGASEEVDTSNLPSTMSEARKNKKVISLSITGFVNSWLILGFSAFLAHLLVYDMGVDAGFTAAIMSLTFIAGVAGSILGGVVSDTVFKGSRYQTIMIGAALTGLGFIALPIVGGAGNVAIVVALMIAYLGANLIMGPLWACPASLVQPKVVGPTTAFANVIANIGGLIVSPILALTIDATGSAMPALWICVVVSIVGIIAARIVHV